jgi:hypothetical protein
MRLKDMSVHVSTCTTYDFNALMPVVWKVWRCKDVFVYTSRRFLEQRIDIKFCAKLGKNASDTCAMLSDTYGGDRGEL